MKFNGKNIKLENDTEKIGEWKGVVKMGRQYILLNEIKRRIVRPLKNKRKLIKQIEIKRSAKW